METFYRTWTALQSHIRSAHPPTCPHISCKGKTFSSRGGLRAHQKIHEARDEEEQMEATLLLEGADTSTGEPPKKKRRGGEMGRDWKCEYSGCQKDFKSASPSILSRPT